MQITMWIIVSVLLFYVYNLVAAAIFTNEYNNLVFLIKENKISGNFILTWTRFWSVIQVFKELQKQLIVIWRLEEQKKKKMDDYSESYS